MISEFLFDIFYLDRGSFTDMFIFPDCHIAMNHMADVYFYFSDCHMADPSRQESLSKIGSCMTAFTSYNFLTSRPSNANTATSALGRPGNATTAILASPTVTAQQTPSLNVLPNR